MHGDQDFDSREYMYILLSVSLLLVQYDGNNQCYPHVSHKACSLCPHSMLQHTSTQCAFIPSVPGMYYVCKRQSDFFLFSCIDTVICMAFYSAVPVKYAAILLSVTGCLQ